MSPNKGHSAKLPVIHFGSTQEDRRLPALGEGLDVISPCCGQSGRSVLAALVVQTFLTLHKGLPARAYLVSAYQFQRKYDKTPGDANLLDRHARITTVSSFVETLGKLKFSTLRKCEIKLCSKITFMRSIREKNKFCRKLPRVVKPETLGDRGKEDCFFFKVRNATNSSVLSRAKMCSLYLSYTIG